MYYLYRLRRDIIDIWLYMWSGDYGSVEHTKDSKREVPGSTPAVLVFLLYLSRT